MKKNPDITFSELFALVSAARITVTETCQIVNVSRETWSNWRKRQWGMGPTAKARAEEMIHGVRYYIEQGVFPAHDPEIHAKALAKVRARVEKKCGAVVVENADVPV